MGKIHGQKVKILNVLFNTKDLKIICFYIIR